MILADLGKEQLNSLVASYGEKSFRAGQIYNNINNGKSISQMTDLSESFRSKLLQDFADTPCEIYKEFHSKDGSIKYLFKLSDGNLIEGVLMKYKYGYTQCVSTQVGCRMGCEFCASTLGGLVRNLTSGEILSQIAVVNKALGGDIKKRQVTNVVLMGSGEPFDNYDNVMKAIRILNEPHGLGIGARHITVSTSGLVPQIMKFAEEGIQANLSISLHATTDELRDKVMPVNKAYNISLLLQACKKYIEKTHRRITFEYAVMYGVNDTIRDACRLADLLDGMLCHVNLIPINPVEGAPYKRPSQNIMMNFRDALNNRGITATIRRELGSDVDAACGQLRRQYFE